MKIVLKITLCSLLSMTSLPLAADIIDNQGSYYSQQTSQGIQKLLTYMLNLGTFLGYNLDQTPPPDNTKVSQQLLDAVGMQLAENYVFNTVLGAIPVNAFSSAFALFVPKNFNTYSAINSFGNTTFNAYSTPDSQEGKIGVSSLIDQKNFQADPVNQSILNILGTPDYTYCMKNDASAWLPDCKLLYQNQVMSNVVGQLPDANTFFTYDYNQQFLSQLNSNALIAPLLYSTEAQNTNSPPSINQLLGRQQNQGLTAQSQAQQAANFIRYATGAVSPVSLPKRSQYMNLINQTQDKDPIKQNAATTALANYFTSLRVYAAQTSVGVSNLYYILSKRMEQDQSTDGSNPTSQALSEFTMATKRLYNPDTKAQPWLNQINQASPATVQKEIAVLLAEINYQLYLSRQQDERILLTNTMLLLQNARMGKPTNNIDPSLTQ